MPDSDSTNGASKDTGSSNEGAEATDNSSVSGIESNDPGKIEFHTVYRFEELWSIEAREQSVGETSQNTKTTAESLEMSLSARR